MVTRRWIVGVSPGDLPRDLATLDPWQLDRAYVSINDAIDRAYWIFTRQARGAPPRAELYQRRKWVLEAMMRVRSPHAVEGTKAR